MGKRAKTCGHKLSISFTYFSRIAVLIVSQLEIVLVSWPSKLLARGSKSFELLLQIWSHSNKTCLKNYQKYVSDKR